MKKVCILLFSIYCYSLSAQVPEWSWIRTIKGCDRIFDVTTDHEGNIFAVGSFHDSITNDQGIKQYPLRINRTAIFCVKLNPDGQILWIKTVSAKFPIYEARITLNKLNNNPVIAFFAPGDSIQYEDSIINYPPFHPDTSTTAYRTYLHLIEYDTYNGTLRQMKLFHDDVPARTYNLYFVYSIICDNEGNFFVSGYTNNSIVGSLVITHKMSLLLDNRFDPVWNYGYTNTHQAELNDNNAIYGGSHCSYGCSFHDIYFDTLESNAFIYKHDKNTGIVSRIHSLQGSPNDYFLDYRFDKENNHTVYIEGNQNTILDDSIHLDSTFFHRIIYGTNSSVALEYDSNFIIRKKCVITGSLFYGNFMLKNGANYYTVMTADHNNVYINDDSITGNKNYLLFAALDTSMKLTANKYISYKSGGPINYMSGSISSDPWFLQKMLKDAAGNIIVKFDYNDTITTDNGLTLAPQSRWVWSSYIAKMGNNTTTRISSQATTYNEFKIYPNPTSGLINVSLIGSSSIKSIRIYDLPGKEIFCRTYAVSEGSNNENIDLKGLENGMFIIKIIDNEDRIITSRIIKIADE